MITSAKRIFLTLGITGLIPFITGAMLAQTGNPLGVKIFLSYSVIILAFLSGAMWGQAFRSAGIHKRLLVLSNAIALLAWTALLLDEYRVSLGLLIIGYVLSYVTERHYMKWLPTAMTPEYQMMRLWLTIIASALHLWVLTMAP